MSFLKRLFGQNEVHPRESLRALYNNVVAKAREPHWYEVGAVPDSVDGRFDMLAAVLALVLLRLERDPENAQNAAYLTEVFVQDMDGQLREIGIGDMIVGKHIGRMMASLGGRLGAFRSGLGDMAKLDDAITRNIYRGAVIERSAAVHVREGLIETQGQLKTFSDSQILGGDFNW